MEIKTWPLPLRRASVRSFEPNASSGLYFRKGDSLRTALWQQTKEGLRGGAILPELRGTG